MPLNNLSLKQRLSALSLAPPSPTNSSPDSPSSSHSPTSRLAAGLNSFGAKRKQIFNPAALKQKFKGLHSGGAFGGGGGGGGEMAYAPGELADWELVQEVMSRLIFQAGVDYETRPMVVICASALPDPAEISYDLLLSRIMSYLNLYVESDYTIVFFAAGGRHTPGWNWVWKAYRSLSRKYRKNLKQLYIVHTSFFSKMLFSLAGAIISPKFFRKLVYIPTLSELAHHVPLTQIDIPPAVYAENLKFESQITLPVPTRSLVFGVPLEDLMGYEGERGSVPRVVKDCAQFLREGRAMEEDGLFRRSPSSGALKSIKEAYDRGHVVSLHTFNDPHLAAVLLKKYLRDLPVPIFPEALYTLIRRCPPPPPSPSSPVANQPPHASAAAVDQRDANRRYEDELASTITYLRETLFPELVPCAYLLLSYVLHLLHDVALRAATNRMDAHNLAVVVCPNLVKGSNPVADVKMCAVPGGPAFFPIPIAGAGSAGGANGATARPQQQQQQPPSTTTLGQIIKLCIERYYEIFDEVRDRSEAIAPVNSIINDERALSNTGMIRGGRQGGGEGAGFGGYGAGERGGRGGLGDREAGAGARMGAGAGARGRGRGANGQTYLHAREGSADSYGRSSSLSSSSSSSYQHQYEYTDTHPYATAPALVGLRHNHNHNHSNHQAYASETPSTATPTPSSFLQHQTQTQTQHRPNQPSVGSTRSTRTNATDDDEEIDDTMLVMPLGLGSGPGPYFPLPGPMRTPQVSERTVRDVVREFDHLARTGTHKTGAGGRVFGGAASTQASASTSTSTSTSSSASPYIPSSPSTSFTTSTTSSHPPTAYKPKITIGHRSTNSSVSNSSTSISAASGSLPVSTSASTPAVPQYVTLGRAKAKSAISLAGSISGADGAGAVSGFFAGAPGSVKGRNRSQSQSQSKGTGTGTVKKSAGAGVEALGITAEGFFTAPV